MLAISPSWRARLVAGADLAIALAGGALAAVELVLLPATLLLPRSAPWVWVSFGAGLWAAAALLGAFLLGPPAYLLLRWLGRRGVLDYAAAGTLAAALTVLLLYLLEPFLFPLMGKDLIWEDLLLLPLALAGGALGGVVARQLLFWEPRRPGEPPGGGPTAAPAGWRWLARAMAALLALGLAAVLLEETRWHFLVFPALLGAPLLLIAESAGGSLVAYLAAALAVSQLGRLMYLAAPQPCCFPHPAGLYWFLIAPPVGFLLWLAVRAGGGRRGGSWLRFWWRKLLLAGLLPLGWLLWVEQAYLALWPVLLCPIALLLLLSEALGWRSPGGYLLLGSLALFWPGSFPGFALLSSGTAEGRLGFALALASAGLLLGPGLWIALWWRRPRDIPPLVGVRGEAGGG